MPTPTIAARAIDVDATMEIYNRSKRRTSSHCWIAEAVKQAAPWGSHVAVDLQTIRVTDTQAEKRYVYLTPRIAQIALIKYDAGEERTEGLQFKLRVAQVTKAGRRTRNYEAEKIAKKQAAARKQAAAAAAHVQASAGQRPVVFGGITPPLSNFARVRQFGVKHFVA